MSARVLEGDSLAMLATLPAESFQCCVTSPPYWGLRDYGVAGQLGMESTAAEHVANMVEVFRAVRRVLRDDGTLWLNYGDCYASTPNGRPNAEVKAAGGDDRAFRDKPFSTVGEQGGFRLKPKDLVGMPWRVAFALQADGWYLRADIIWHKPNPMPESVRDRPTKAHEYVFLLTKQPRYFYDQDATLEDVSPNTHARLSQDVQAQIGSDRAHAGGKTNGRMKAVGRKVDPSPRTPQSAGRIKNNASFDAAMAIMPERRNARSVWTVATAAFSDAHFATMPTELARRCILAGSHEGDAVLDPFGGAGTTALVAERLKRHATIIELNPEYAAMARARIVADAPLLADVA